MGIPVQGVTETSINGNGINKFDNSDDCNYKIVFEKLINNLTIYLKLFSRGDFKSLLKTLTRTQVRILGRKLYEIQKQIGSTGESAFQIKLRNFLKEVLEGLQMSLIIHDKYEVLKLESADAFEKAEILDDQDKLIEYLKEKQSSIKIIDDLQVEAVHANIKLEYAIYIERYGVPDPFIFDQDLLTEIIDEINSQ